MAGKSSFRQPIRHGIDTGVAATTAIGNAPVVQKAGVSAGFSSSVQISRMPPNSEGGTVTADIDSFVLDAYTAQTIVSGQADAVLKIGTSGDATYFASVGISGAGRYTITPSEASAGGLDKWYGVGADTSIYAIVSAGGSGAAVDVTGQILTKYVPR